MRISRDRMLMAMAGIVSLRGTCSRLQVGAVISHHGRVLSLGYNGAPAGMAHCDHTQDETRGCQIAVHAEANAVVWAARKGIATEGAELHVTHMPCANCSRLIVNAGIRRVVFEFPYRLTEGVELLRDAGVEVREWPWLT